MGPTTYFLCLSLSKLHLPFIFINGEDLNPIIFYFFQIFLVYIYPNRFGRNGEGTKFRGS